MKILIVGNGGREHALLWKLRRDAPDATFYATRPNGGMAPFCRAVDLAPTAGRDLASWAEGESVDLVVVGPERPLADGVVDLLHERGIAAFGPTAAAARIEASKAFAKELMRDAGVPTASYRTFDRLDPALEHIRSTDAPIVVKASGLAAGKGALVCATRGEAEDAARALMEEEAFGSAGRVAVIEECMEGEEISVFAVTDGLEVAPLVASQDHKRIGEGDRGPNTGGMGAYAPVSLATPALLATVEDGILLPTVRALEDRGAPFRGLLYAGLMLTADGPKVVEFNCRFGDPETQVVLPLLESSLLDPLLAVARGGSLDGWKPTHRDGAALTTVLASDGYPGTYETGFGISVPEELEADEDVVVFHAGTSLGPDGTAVTAGGRVIAVTGLGETLADAADRSRRGAEAIRFKGKYFRGDIGWKEFARDEESRP